MLLKPMLANFGDRPLIMLSLATQIASQLMYIFFRGKLVVMGVQNVVAAFNVLLQVCCSGLVSAYTPATEQGFTLGTLSAVTSVVSMLGPALFGSLYSWAKGPPMDFPQLPFVLAGVLSTMSFSVAAVPPRGS
jgi:MFS family permease